jgi:ribosomal protein L40E
MKKREIKEHIIKNYILNKNICLLCSEPTASQCHRSLVANIFVDIDKEIKIINL